MIYFWFLIFPLKINNIMLENCFILRIVKKERVENEGGNSLSTNPPSVIEVHILASPTFWDGWAMSRDTEPIHSNVSDPWFCLVQVLWSQQGNGMQGGAILRCQGGKKNFKKKKFLKQLSLSTFMNLANWRLPQWDQCLPLYQVPGVGFLSLPCLRIVCLAAGGCLDFHHNLWSYPCSQEPAHRAQPAMMNHPLAVLASLCCWQGKPRWVTPLCSEAGILMRWIPPTSLTRR